MPLKETKNNAALRPHEADPETLGAARRVGRVALCLGACSARLRLRGPELVFCEWISALPCPNHAGSSSLFPSDSDSQHSTVHQMMLFSY